MELYEYARPDIMAGKKILYVHGFASGGQNGTVKAMETLLPETQITAPDLPVDPHEAMALLHGICDTEKPDLIIGTSMGGMYTEQLHGFDRILVNPALHLADTILKNNGLGRQEYHCPRRDGQTSFLVNKVLVEAFREVSSHCFESTEANADGISSFGETDDEKKHVYGLFGIHDTLVTGTFDEFASHYPNAIKFNGAHYMDDSVFMRCVLPVIERVDDAQEKHRKPAVIITLTDTLMDVRSGESKGLKINEMEPFGSAVKAFAHLCRNYTPFVLIQSSANRPEIIPELIGWTAGHLGVPAWNRIIVSNRKDMVLGDYLIDRYPERLGAEDFMGTVLHFGEDPFRTWEDVTAYFDQLGGQ